MQVLYKCHMHENLCCEHGKPHTGWLSYKHCVHKTNTENLHWVVFMYASQAQDWTAEPYTHTGTWQPVKKKESEIKGSMIG